MEYAGLYYGTLPNRAITISQLFTIHYFENFEDYFFPGERHNFWELLYVDRGEILVETDRFPEPICMRQGDLILHRPNEFHSFYANSLMPHNLLVLSFSTPSPAMEQFDHQVLFRRHPAVRLILGQILDAAKDSFSSPLGDPNVPRLIRRPEAPFGSEQILINYLELLLITLYRSIGTFSGSESPEQPAKFSANYVDTAIDYMKANLTTRIRLEDICSQATVSRSQLQKAFSRQTGKSVMEYLASLRIAEAKFLIRTRRMSFTEIAERLCYSSVHHFSRQFHAAVGMSPSEYVASVQAMTEGGDQ